MLKNRSPISLNAILLTALVLVRLHRYPAFFFPRDPTFFDRFPDWLHLLLGRPSNGLVNNPISLAIVSLSTGLLLTYLLLDFFKQQCESSKILVKFNRITRITLIVSLIFLTVGIPVAWEMLCRAQSEPHQFAHDGGVIQTEEAVKMVLDGRNPYRETYHNTPMRAYARHDNDPPLHHWPYLPFYLVCAVPAYQISNSLFGWFDMRLLYLVFFAGSLLIVWKLSADRTTRLTALILYGFNPFLIPFLVEGRNDIVPLTFLLAAALAALHDKPRLAVLATALACTSKQFAWLFIPYMALYLNFFQIPQKRKQHVALIFWFLIPVLIIIAPFVVWDFHAFYDDVVAFNAGNTEINYLIGGTPGYGASNFLLTWESVKSRTQYYPFWIWMLFTAVPVMALTLYKTHKQRSVSNALCGFAILLLTLLYFSRLLHDNYLGFILALFIAGYAASTSEQIPADFVKKF